MQLLRPRQGLPHAPAVSAADDRATAVTATEVAGGCRCGHVAHAHEHYRRGSDCALCGCGRYRPEQGQLRRVTGRLRSLFEHRAGVSHERSGSV